MWHVVTCGNGYPVSIIDDNKDDADDDENNRRQRVDNHN